MISGLFKVNQATMVFCYQNCSNLLREKIILVIEKRLLKFEAEIHEFTKFLRSLEQFIQTVKGQFLVTECFFNLFLEVLKMFYNLYGKVRCME